MSANIILVVINDVRLGVIGPMMKSQTTSNTHEIAKARKINNRVKIFISDTKNIVGFSGDMLILLIKQIGNRSRRF